MYSNITVHYEFCGFYLPEKKLMIDINIYAKKAYTRKGMPGMSVCIPIHNIRGNKVRY